MPDPTNPYAAYGGQVATPSGTTTADPYAAYGGTVAAAPSGQATTDPYAAYNAAPTPTPKRPDEVLPTAQQLTSFGGPPSTIGAGAAKKLRQYAAGLTELADRYLTGQVPGGTVPIPTLPVGLPQGGSVDTALQKAAAYLRQDSEPQGAIEKAGAIIPDIATLAAPELWAEKGATEGMSAADKVMAMGRNLKTLEKNPGLLKMLQNSASSAASGAGRAALPAAALTNVQTGGDPEATAKAALTAGAIGAPLEAIPTAVTDIASALRPTAETLEGVEMPVAASQRANAPLITKLASPPEELPAMEAERQAAAPQIVQNGAQRALKTVLDDVNLSRGMMQGPPEAEGVPAGAFKFTVAPHGEPVETTDPNFVQKLLNEARDLRESDAFGTMAPRQQQRVTDTADSLADQLDQYHAEMASRPHFVPIDTEKALASATDYRTAGDIMQNSIDDIYQRMRGAANEQLDKKWLKELSPSDFNQLMEQNADKFSPAERQMATDTFRKGVALKEFHNAIQQGFNISPAQEAATADIGGARTFTGSNKISNAIDDVVQQHGDDLRSMIGDQGINSVRRMNQLMKGPDTADGLQKILRNTAAILRRHHGGVAGFIGSAAAPFLGVSHLTGMAGGAATGYAMQKVINSMATNPVIADRMAYAVEHGVSQHVVAPLIAMMMMRNTPPQPGGQQ